MKFKTEFSKTKEKMGKRGEAIVHNASYNKKNVTVKRRKRERGGKLCVGANAG